MKVLVTGSCGFVGKYVCAELTRKGHKLVEFDFANGHNILDINQLNQKMKGINAVVHLAGVNRPPLPENFITGNTGLTQSLCEALLDNGRSVPVIFTSSIQAAQDNPYGKSKFAAESALRDYAAQSGAAGYIYRLPNVFGKWGKPN